MSSNINNYSKLKVYTIGRTYVSGSEINKLALPITISNSGEVRFLQMFHHRLANATRVFFV